MDSNQLAHISPENMSLAQTLAQSVEIQQNSVEKLAAIIVMLDKRLHSVEAMMENRVTVSSSQARSIANAVGARAHEICDQNALPYSTAGRTIREAIWRALRSEYQIPSHYDLSAIYYEHALSFVKGWTSFTVIRKARQRSEIRQ